ncbi:SulP family inorganic anion transporter [Entomobacter blattae]|uniref:Bicarbonate transporter BicA n=1 Tax=Entomobacter blattae TaxID=2762277 RepID=A0A7H1NRD9_9PROT|nr:SulP family inorganic anion transporter [Entomobacter blattae]QNT78349.1 Bicarbonate transporter BicA [Entomobacter blattae]
MTPTHYRQEWLGNIRQDILAGMVSTFALIPEVIAFSFVAGVAPEVGLYATFIISIVIAFTGGRAGMVSGAAGSVALVAAALVRGHGIDYLFAATILAGLFQVLIGLLRLHVLMQYVSRPVRTGFVNALAILIFSAQLPHLLGANWQTYLITALGLAIIYLAPFMTTLIPSPLIAIIALTALYWVYPMPLHTVADLGALPTGFPGLVWPHIPLTFESLEIIVPYAAAMALVGALESLMTATVVDDLTETHSNKRRECTGLGIANMAVGFFGGIAGCGMIGQTVGNLRYGGVGRLSTFMAGAFLLLLMDVLRPFVAQVPVAVLVAIMIMVSISTFSWSSLREITFHPKTSTLCMLATVIVVVATKDLAIGVIVGVMLNGIFFAWQLSRLLEVSSTLSEDATTRIYTVKGQIFFASSTLFENSFKIRDNVKNVKIDLSDAHFWDVTATGALDTIVTKMKNNHLAVTITGLKKDNAAFVSKQSTLKEL